jgi:site-specific DNA recombinase
MKSKKAILYIRVSTDEQAEKGHSLQHQEERLRNHCAINGIEVVALFKEDYSAKTFDRPEFTKLLSYIKKNKEQADLLLFLKWDRFSRNAPEAYNMINTLHKYRVEPQSIEQPLDLNIPENKIMLAIYLTTPEVENDRRSLNTIAGMRRALKNGQWTGQAPIGYVNRRDDNNKPIVLFDANTSELVKYAFELFAEGQYPIEVARKMVNEKGLKVSRNAFWVMLRNPFYVGKIIVPAYKDEDSMLVTGKHDPLISIETFNDVQDVLLGRKKIGMPARRTKQSPLPLRGFLRCAKCGKTLTGSGSKGNGGKYYYYHCFDGCKERFKAEKANEKFFEILRSISGHKKLLLTIKHATTGAYKKDNKDQNAKADKVKQEIELYRSRLENARTLMLDRDLDPTEYKEIKEKLEKEIRNLVKEESKLKEKNPEEQEIMEFGIYFLRNMVELITDAALEEKDRLIGSMLPKKAVFENDELRTDLEEGVIPALLATMAVLDEIKEEGLKKFNPSSCLVPQAGIEPALALLQTGF